MALQDFLGKTVEVKIIDFLAENPAFTYNQTEIAECVGISRQSVSFKLPELIYNGIIEVKEKRSNANYYQLVKNEIVRNLIRAIFANGLFLSEYEDDEKTIISGLKEKIGPIPYYEENECFCYPDKTSESIFPLESPEIFEEPEVMYNKKMYTKRPLEYNLNETVTASA